MKKDVIFNKIFYFTFLFELFLFHTILDAESVVNHNNLTTKELFYSCLEEDKKSCEYLIDNELQSVEECDEKSTCIAIAHIYNIARQYNNAMPYLQKSCNYNIMEACFELAYNHELVKQYLKAKKIYESSCEYGFMPSCYNLAMLYVNGHGVEVDNKKANGIFFMACSNDDEQSCYNLAVSYKNGYGFKADRLQAKKFFKKACDLGMQSGCNEYKIIDSADFSITIKQHINDNINKQDKGSP